MAEYRCEGQGRMSVSLVKRSRKKITKEIQQAAATLEEAGAVASGRPALPQASMSRGRRTASHRYCLLESVEPAVTPLGAVVKLHGKCVCKSPPVSRMCYIPFLSPLPSRQAWLSAFGARDQTPAVWLLVGEWFAAPYRLSFVVFVRERKRGKGRCGQGAMGKQHFFPPLYFYDHAFHVSSTVFSWRPKEQDGKLYVKPRKIF